MATAEAVLDLVRLARRDRELAGYLEDIAEQPLSFAGRHAIAHSATNHRHLWLVEYRAQRREWIDTSFRAAAVRYILQRWRARLPSYARSSPRGFRLYCYEDMAPTVSAVGETGEGCPYGGDLAFVGSLREVVAPYADRPWSANFAPLAIDGPAILKALGRGEGSLSTAARALGLPLAELRRRIEWWGLAPDVNRIRKQNQRRPAHFRGEGELPSVSRIYEEIVPPA